MIPGHGGERRRLRLRLILAGLAIFAAFCIEVESLPGNQGDATLWGFRGPDCVLRRLTAHPCPGCGLTRSTACIAQGRFDEAWRFNPAGYLVVAMLLVTLFVDGLALRSGRPRHAAIERGMRWSLAGGVLVAWLAHVFNLAL